MASKKKTAQSRKRSRPVEPKKVSFNTNYLIIIVAAIVIICIGIYFITANPGGKNNENNNPQETGNPIAIIDTSLGTIKVELYEEKTPKTCENFIKLAKEGFYDGMIFHRILDDFMIQAGNTYPDGSIATSPYGNIDFESYEGLLHEDGSISMASTGWEVGGSAQFFICDGAQSGLDGGYAVFGKTIEGIEVVRDIADNPQDGSSSAGGGKPIEDILINSITIEE